jgi:hypothetical protein
MPASAKGKRAVTTATVKIINPSSVSDQLNRGTPNRELAA